jgi:hypothetical protein
MRLVFFSIPTLLTVLAVLAGLGGFTMSLAPGARIVLRVLLALGCAIVGFDSYLYFQGRQWLAVALAWLVGMPLVIAGLGYFLFVAVWMDAANAHGPGAFR